MTLYVAPLHPLLILYFMICYKMSIIDGLFILVLYRMKEWLMSIRYLKAGKDMVEHTGHWYSRMEIIVGESSRIKAQIPKNLKSNLCSSLK